MKRTTTHAARESRARPRQTTRDLARTAGVAAVAFVATVALTSTPTAAGTPAEEPPALSPSQRAARVELGRRLFFDPAASRTGTVACADCHAPDHGFSDPRERSVDEFETTRRHSQPVTDLLPADLLSTDLSPSNPAPTDPQDAAPAADDDATPADPDFTPRPRPSSFHWDGEFPALGDLLFARLGRADDASVVAELRRLRAQGFTGARPQQDSRMCAPQPPGYGAVTADLRWIPDVEARLGSGGLYGEAFLAAYGDADPTLARILDSLTEYLATVRTAPNRLDRHVAGDANALPEDARRGYALFEGRAGCAVCHSTDTVADSQGLVPLTDGSFHDTGVASRVPGTSAGLPVRAVTGEADGGRGERTLRPEDRLRFKTPSLRDVARRPPYMHDGSFATLADVVDYYDAGGTPHPGLSPHVRDLGLTASEKSDLVAFLECLTGDDRPGLAEAPSDVGRESRVRVVDLKGRPLARLDVEVSAAGDRFRGTKMPTARTPVRTDTDGWAKFAFPPSTHARLHAPGMSIGAFAMIPDTADLATLTAVPNGKVALRVRVPSGAIPEEILAVRTRLVGRGRRARTETVEFTLVRTLAPDDALYAADAPGGGLEKEDVTLVPVHSGKQTVARPARLDLRGGCASLVELRDRSGGTVLVGGPLGNVVASIRRTTAEGTVLAEIDADGNARVVRNPPEPPAPEEPAPE